MPNINEIKIWEQLELHRAIGEHDFSDVEKMAAVFNLTKTPLAIGSADSNTLEFMNPAFAALHGYTVEEFLGKPIFDIFAPEVRERALEDIKRADELGHMIYESKHRRKDGTVFPVQTDATAIRDTKKNLLFRIFTVHDITERKRVEEQINTLMEELQRSNQDLEHFSIVLAHDLKGPLIAVSGTARLLLKRYADRLNDNGKEYVTLIQESARRMLTLINELREYAKSGAGPKPLKEVDMEQVVRQAIENLRMDIEEYKVNIKTDLMPVVKGDEVQLIQLVQNLISNSIKYRKMDAPLNVLISSENRGAEWVFRFKDNGIGIERSLFKKIFLMFHRGTAEGQEGMGLGLAICKRIVERHGGRIWVNAMPGKGTSFYFSLPIRD